MLIKLYAENPNTDQVRRVTWLLDQGGIIICPTDTIYAMACDIRASRAIEKIARFKGLNPANPAMSFIFNNFSQLSDYTVIRDNDVFRLLKRNLPGPFTFIVKANNQVPALFRNKKKTVGIRIPDNNIILELIRDLGRPLITSSLHEHDDVIEYMTDPELIHEKYRDFADMVIDGGYGGNIPSTVVDCTGDEPVVVRQGLGILEY
ncbi:MAG TPA: L-threonylcarbamoyladenylate synthase [Bacteroidales bacterium]|nr:L-threonylcarbamoyladenylate synthase [Bacteroidales bacterium]HPT11477.1 L-threonylcarbamoyladenylate synthase [Bacteroidales bacterium]